MTQTAKPAVDIRPAMFPNDRTIVGELFLAYAQSLPISLDFQNFEHELAGLPGKYAVGNGGALYLAYTTSSTEPFSEQVIGCVAIRPFTPPESCELKRLYLTPESRGLGVSKILMDAALCKAKELGYKEMLLDTLRSMTPARRLYEGYGFVETEEYYKSVEDAVFYRLVLRANY
ncbi:acyl-CoA N-acyltransferase [Dothidotthia symphoricarpi CBS 119687]|uniref:Acyl-CoA N-acyltransferase n=1 Tax=Dothidotthia symphoricarpi CBS 119687 TaxID=1392245 RepID=A0A6A6AAG7_9PLEO|nr:acyl-CoA N-acyltransferase [Dothidotthia symphoricarpi CBS 119687]KAF2127681.1 acyl-CoA N-acyltransferase [Dothidotthia symphoricarpi CBS 119687]